MDVWTFGRFGLVLLCLACSACQTERVTSDGRPLPDPPRAAPVTPTGAQVNEMLFVVGAKPRDSDGNGYPDLIDATVALFASPHPTSIRQEGALEFALYPRGDVGDGRALARWRFEQDALEQHLTAGPYGARYQFQLRLLEQGGDRYPLMAADLRAAFIPADDSPPVHSDGVRSIQIGRR